MATLLLPAPGDPNWGDKLNVAFAALNSDIGSRALPGDFYTKAASDVRYVRKVNGVVPDANGNVAVAAGTSGITQAAADARYPRTINGVGPDGAGNIAIATGGGSSTVLVPGIVGNGTTNEGLTIQAFLDTIVNDVTHSLELVVQAPSTSDKIYINSTVQIENDNVHLVFRNPLVFGPLGRIRINGELSELPATNVPILTAPAAAGSTVLSLNNTAPFAVGNLVLIRGAREPSGNRPENQREYHNVLSKTTTTITLAEPLENDYVVVNENPGAPSSLAHDTVVSRIVTSTITAPANRGDYTITVADSSTYAVGDYIEVMDDAVTTDVLGVLEANNFIHREMAEVKNIVSSTVIRISHALHHTYDLSQRARVTKVSPVRFSTIEDATVTWNAMSTVSNAFEVNYGVGCSMKNLNVIGDGVKSWRSQAFRLGHSYFSETVNCYATDPADTSAGRGYGATLYAATYCRVMRSSFSSLRHSVLFYLGAVGNIVANCQSEDVCLSDYDFHGGECMDNIVTNCLAIGGSAATTDGSSLKAALRVGNASHVNGDHFNTFSDIKVLNYKGVGFDVLPQSKGNKFEDSDVRNAYTGVKLRYNNSVLDLANQFSGDTVVSNVDFHDMSVALTDIDGGTNNEVHGLVLDNCRWWRAAFTLSIKNASKVHVRRNSWYDPNLPSGVYAVNALNVAGLTVRDNDMSLATRGVKIANCPSARISKNTLHDLVETMVLEDGGGNTNAYFGHNDIFGFTPITSITGGATISTNLVIDIERPYQSDSPRRHGLLEWNYDPMIGTSSTVLTSGSLYVDKITPAVGGTILNLHVTVITSGVTLTSGGCHAVLYDSAGVELARTADMSTTWNSTGFKTMALNTAVNLRAGADYYVAIIAVGTTPPALLRGATAISTLNAGQSAALQRFSVNGTGLTAAPSSITPGSNSAVGAVSIWVAMS